MKRHDGPGNIYLLERTGKTKVKRIFHVHVSNMAKYEDRLHRLFKNGRIRDITKKRWSRNGWQVKIGLTSKEVEKRIKEINDSKLKDGKTEYFRTTPIVIVLMVFWMQYYEWIRYFQLAFLLILIAISFYLK